jgi:hydroxymethylpyrimidine/phosphomethylpyrimidine kinase
MTKPARILTIAGSDCSGGAGLQADLKTIIMLGGYGMSAITAITAQNTRGVYAVEALSAQMVGAQIDACVDDIGVDAVKIGMLGSGTIAHAVADRLEILGVPVVFDPVMIATSGGVLADGATIEAFARLMALATLTTPNVPELAALGGAEALVARGVAFLAKGAMPKGLSWRIASTCPVRRSVSGTPNVSTPAIPTARAALWPALSPRGWVRGWIWCPPSNVAGRLCGRPCWRLPALGAGMGLWGMRRF